MAKQQKMLNKIAHSIDCGQKTPSGTKPNDECYTSMQDILNELAQWAEFNKFRDKNIICPCDWDIDDDNAYYGIKITYQDKIRVTVDYYDENGVFVTTEIQDHQIENFLFEKVKCNFIRTLHQSARRWGIKSITASGYNPSTGKGIKFQDVDYSKYDLCVTNPPFSLYGEFMKCIVGKIDFICLAPFLNRVNPNIGLPLMLRQAYLGFNIHQDLNFKNPTSENEFKTKKVACDWITSFPEAQEARNADNALRINVIRYDNYKDDYLVMENMTMKDGTHPIRVPSQFPGDYKGWMFAGVNILDILDLNQYEWYGTSFQKYYNTTNPDDNPFNHKVSDAMLKANGKQMFHGIIFRKKPTQSQQQ